MITTDERPHIDAIPIPIANPIAIRIAIPRQSRGLCGVLLLFAMSTVATGELQESTAVRLAGGSVHVAWNVPLRTPQPDVLIHFHGTPRVTTRNFAAAELDGVLVTVNFNGLSAAYAGPFREDPQLLDKILQLAIDQIQAPEGGAANAAWGRISLSSFSAGYGAVREILKDAAWFERIQALVAADSIYASLAEDRRQRRPRAGQMSDFRRFAKLAAAGKRTFVVTHSEVATRYASTFDTANDLLRFVGIEREQVEDESGSLQLTTQAKQGNFFVFGYAGDEGEDHLEHLRQIQRWWKLLRNPDP